MEQPLFTVVLPNFNTEKFLKKSISSVLEQTFRDFELIIIDNRSTDTSMEIIKQFNDDRIRIYQQPANLGMYANINVGIMLAKGKYCKVQCSDDVMHPQCLEALKLSIESVEDGSDKPIYMGHGILVGEKGKEYSQAWLDTNMADSLAVSKISILDDNVPAGLPVVCVDTDAFRKFGCFGTPNHIIDFSRDLLRLGLFANECNSFTVNHQLIFERAHDGQSRYSMKKQWQLNELHELYSSTGFINTDLGKRKLKVIAGHHLLSSIKYLFVEKSFSYMIHTTKFSIQKKLIGVTYLKSFFNRISVVKSEA